MIPSFTTEFIWNFMLLVTGAAGFIGFHLCRALLARNASIVALDNFNDYYSVALKEARAAELKKEGLTVERLDLCDREGLQKLFQTHKIDCIIHLAAQAGVRYSFTHPESYVHSNLVGFSTLIEIARLFQVPRFIYASSSSVYGDQAVPFSLSSPTDRPLNLYAATKKANEEIAYAYHHLWGMQCIGLRFFTVYGPWGRPDMAYFHFAKAITEGQPIELFGKGLMERDFTYIDDIIDGVLATLQCREPYALFNLGGSETTPLLHFVEILEELIGKKAQILYRETPQGEMQRTWADISLSTQKLGFSPKTKLKEGLSHFVDWFKSQKGY